MSLTPEEQELLALMNRVRMVTDWLRVHALDVRRLADFGDRESIKFEETYRAAYKFPLAIPLQKELVHVWEEYLTRDLTLTERVILQNRFGHKVPE